MFNPWAGKSPWRRERQPTPVFWPGEFHRLHIPWGSEELDMTEQLSHILLNEVTHTHTHTHTHTPCWFCSSGEPRLIPGTKKKVLCILLVCNFAPNTHTQRAIVHNNNIFALVKFDGAGAIRKNCFKILLRVEVIFFFS